LFNNHKPLDTQVVTVISEVVAGTVDAVTGVVMDIVAGMTVDLSEATTTTEVVVPGAIAILAQWVTIVTKVLAILDKRMVTVATRSRATMMWNVSGVFRKVMSRADVVWT
jgi:hypothetical protein